MSDRPLLEGPLPDGLLDDIEDFLIEDAAALTARGCDIYPAIYSRPILFPLQRPAEQAKMMRIARSISPKTVMEIGLDKGAGAFLWPKCLPTLTRFIGCEIRGCPYGRLFERAFPDVEYLWLPFPSSGPSGRETVEIVRRLTDKTGPIDVLFIDGDKLAFADDFEAYLPMMSPTGIVLFHDITSRVSGRAYRGICDRGYRHEEIVDTSDYIEMVASGRGPSTQHDRWLLHWHGTSCGVGVLYLS